MDGESHACGLVVEGGGMIHCVVDGCRRESGMEVKGDAGELDGVRHSNTRANGQGDGYELGSRGQYVQ